MSEGLIPMQAATTNRIPSSVSIAPSRSSNTLNQRSCVTCRRRKVKCDKNQPCSNCIRAHIECLYPAAGRAPRKVRKPPDVELVKRLKRLEAVVQSFGTQINGETQRESLDEANFKSSEKENSPINEHYIQEKCPFGTDSANNDITDSFETQFGRLVINEGRSRYVHNSFWASLNREVEDLKEILTESNDYEGDSTQLNPEPTNSENHGWLFGYSSQDVDLLSLHPPAEKVPVYWQVYKENVDPIVKVLHIPSIEPAILEATEHLDILPKGLECLMFSIYYSAATTLSPAECLERLSFDRQTALKRYRFGLEQALAKAHFLDSDENVVLQSLVIFLFLLRRNEDARRIWTLTGLVVRIAHAQGIHRDGGHFNISPFETEMRRRLWWQVLMLDARSNEDHGSDQTIMDSTFDTLMPRNVDDTDLQPNMKEPPKSRSGFTEMTFSLVRFEIIKVFRRLLHVPPRPSPCNHNFARLPVEIKEQWIKDCHKKIEETYLKDCDMSEPQHWATATLSRLIMGKMWLLIYHPFQRAGKASVLPQNIRDQLYISSLESMEYSILLETDFRTKQWAWMFQTYAQWHALAFLLTELCVRTKGELVERAWRAIEATAATRWGGFLDDSKKRVLWKPLRKLLAKARIAREQELIQERSQGVDAAAEYLYPEKAPEQSSIQATSMSGYPNIDAMIVTQTGNSSPLDSLENMRSTMLGDSISTSEAADMQLGDPYFGTPNWFDGDPLSWVEWNDMIKSYGQDSGSQIQLDIPDMV